MEDARTANAEQAVLLLDMKLHPLLNHLMRGERSASEVAVHLGVSLQRAHYLLGKLTVAGVAVRFHRDWQGRERCCRR